MTSDSRTVMVIAGGEWQVPIVAKAKALGHRVVCTNLYEDSPAFALADVGVVADVLDGDANLMVATQEHPDAVVTDQSDIAVPTVALVADRLGLPGIGVAVAARFTNKLAMRTCAASLDIPQPWFRSLAAPDAANVADLPFPVVVKPPASQSSRGVARVDDRRALDRAVRTAASFSSDGTVLIEQYIDGTELTAEGIMTAGGHVTLAISTKDHLAHNPMVASRLVYRQDDADIPFHHLRAQNDRLIEGMGLPFGLTHTEYKYSAGQFFLIETAARGGGTKVSSHIVPFMSALDTNAMLIRMALGEKIGLPAPETGDRAAILEFLTFPSGAVTSVQGVDEARALPGVLDLGLTFGVGSVLQPPADDRSRHLHVIATGPTPESAADVIDQVRRTIVVRHG